MKKFDYLVVGSGLYGAIFAHEAKAHGKSVLVVDKRPNIAGNIYTEKIEDINVHMVHIFFTLTIKKYGIILHSLQNLIVLQILRLLIIKVNFILFRLICTHSTRCGEL